MVIIHECYKLFWTNPGSSTPWNNSCAAHYLPTSKTIQVRRTWDAGQCSRSKDELISDVLLRIRTHIRTRVCRPARTYFYQFCVDTGCSLEDLPRVMDDRDGWKERGRERERERESGKPVLSARFDGNDLWFRKKINGLQKKRVNLSYLPTPLLGQDMTQGQFLSGV